MKVPISAIPIAEARRKGMKPADMVIISLVGRVNENNPTVFVNSPDHAWWWCRGLEICVYTDKRAKWARILAAIAKERPAKLLLWDVDRLQGAYVYYLPTVESLEARSRGSQRHLKWELSFIPWLDFQNNEFAWG